MTKREKNITRFDYRNTHGWWVRFQRSTEGGEKRVTSKLFSDAICGGKRKALAAAILWRDRMVKRVPPPRRSPNSERVPPGYGYIKRVSLARRVGVSPVYLAWIRLHDGRAASTTYSIKKWGVKEAKRLSELYLARKRRELRSSR